MKKKTIAALFVLLSSNAYGMDDNSFIEGFVQGANFSCFKELVSTKAGIREVLIETGKRFHREKEIEAEIKSIEIFNLSPDQTFEIIAADCDKKNEEFREYAKNHILPIIKASENKSKEESSQNLNKNGPFLKNPYSLDANGCPPFTPINPPPGGGGGGFIARPSAPLPGQTKEQMEFCFSERNRKQAEFERNPQAFVQKKREETIEEKERQNEIANSYKQCLHYIFQHPEIWNADQSLMMQIPPCKKVMVIAGQSIDQFILGKEVER